MQRSITHKNSLKGLIYLGLFVLYSSLATIYPFLPPLFAVLFFLFVRALEQNSLQNLLLVCAAVFVFEVNYGYVALSGVVFFYLMYKFVLPWIYTNFSCSGCIRFSLVILSYVGYFFFMSLVANIFHLELPNINYYIIYYIVIEFLIISVLT